MREGRREKFKMKRMRVEEIGLEIEGRRKRGNECKGRKRKRKRE